VSLTPDDENRLGLERLTMSGAAHVAAVEQVYVLRHPDRLAALLRDRTNLYDRAVAIMDEATGGFVQDPYASEALAALEAAGWRIVPPGDGT
jgi:hypothetical protein